MKQILVAVALVMVGLMPGVSQAVPIFEDNFDGENGGVADISTLNYASFTKWAISNGTVDLIGNGYFDFLPTNGLYVDLDGSTNDAGIMKSSPLTLTGGVEYILTFDLAGSQRGDINTLTYGIDLNNDGTLDVTPVDITVDGTDLTPDPFITQSLLFTPLSNTTVASIRFGQDGGDNQGLLLDNVKLSAVPEPASLMLLGAGLAAIGIWRRKAVKG